MLIMGQIKDILENGIDLNVRIEPGSAALLAASIFAAIVAANLVKHKL